MRRSSALRGNSPPVLAHIICIYTYTYINPQTLNPKPLGEEFKSDRLVDQVCRAQSDDFLIPCNWKITTKKENVSAQGDDSVISCRQFWKVRIEVYLQPKITAQRTFQDLCLCRCMQAWNDVIRICLCVMCVNDDILQRQKTPTREAKETYHRGKRDPSQRQIRPTTEVLVC